MKKEIIIAGIMGVMSSPTFAQNFYQCTPCPAGTYAESGQCKSCSAGTFSKGATSSCEACPAGTYSSSSASFCAPCQNKPANSHYTSSATNSTSDSCSWACDSGFSKSGNLCCANGYSKFDGKCCPYGKIKVSIASYIMIKNLYEDNTPTKTYLGCNKYLKKNQRIIEYNTKNLGLGECVNGFYNIKKCNVCGTIVTYCPDGSIETEQDK